MKTILAAMDDHLSSGRDLVLATITAASGATPRGAGARMLVDAQGYVCGTIGGGAVEYRAIQMSMQVLTDKTACSHDFCLNRDDVEKLGMICGGDVRVFFSYLSPGDRSTLDLVRTARQLYAGGENLWLLSDLADGGRLGLYSPAQGFLGPGFPAWLEPELTRQPHRVQRDGCDFFVEQIQSAGRVYIFGGGHVAQELEPVLSRVGFRCVILEDRPEFAKKELFPTAEEIRLVDFYHIADSVSITNEDYVCIMTRGHAYDTVLQAQILRAGPCYAGVIGSRSKAAAVRRVLAEEYSLTDEELDRVTTPIGLSIGAKSPAEIAISIAAQLIQVRAEQNSK